MDAEPFRTWMVPLAAYEEMCIRTRLHGAGVTQIFTHEAGSQG